MITIENISFSYKNKLVFKDFSFEIKEGEFYALMGKNASGKTTLFQCIMDLQKFEGDIFIDGISLKESNSNKNMFFIPEHCFLPNLTIEEYSMSLRYLYKDFDLKLFHEICQYIEINPKLSLKQLSFGQTRKVILSIAISTRVKYIFFDEITNGIDIVSKSKIRSIITKYIMENQTFVFSTHQIHDIEELISQVAIIDKGELLLNESYSDIQEKLNFGFIDNSVQSNDILYREKGELGGHGIYKNISNQISQPNLELLFQAVLSNPTPITESFK